MNSVKPVEKDKKAVRYGVTTAVLYAHGVEMTTCIISGASPRLSIISLVSELMFLKLKKQHPNMTLRSSSNRLGVANGTTLSVVGISKIPIYPFSWRARKHTESLSKLRL